MHLVILLPCPNFLGKATGAGERKWQEDRESAVGEQRFQTCLLNCSPEVSCDQPEIEGFIHSKQGTIGEYLLPAKEDL